MPTTLLKPKPFTWSFSRLKNYEVCPRRHYEVDLAKNYVEPKTEQLAYGDAVHKAAAEHLSKGKALPKHLQPVLGSWCDKITQQGKVKGILTEQQLAITKDFAPTGWFDKDVWFRTVVDVLRIVPPVALAVDWKTGKIVEDTQQLALAAAAVFAHYDDVQWVRSEFIWLKEDAVTSERYSREGMKDVWVGIWPRIKQLEHAYQKKEYPPKPGYLCAKHCPVTKCEYHGG